MPNSKAPLRVAIVDDEPPARAKLKRLLGEVAGFEWIGEAGTGVEALSLILREKPDLVFLDVKMPGMDGLEVLQRLRHLVEVTPVVVISGHGTVSTAVEATKLGAFDFIEKPLERERVLVTDRDRVVAELAPPQSTRAADVSDAFLAQAVRDGWLKPPLLADKSPPPSRPIAPLSEIIAGLDADRAER